MKAKQLVCECSSRAEVSDARNWSRISVTHDIDDWELLYMHGSSSDMVLLVVVWFFEMVKNL